jgi:uncharacterized protein YbjT (DUF2867 family)
MADILITGGTGTLGRQLVQQLSYQGFDVAILTTRHQVDLPSGAKIYPGDLTQRTSLPDAVEPARIIIHCASNPRDPKTVDLDGTKNLLGCISKKRLQHLIYVSIAGADRSPYPYYQIKFEVEKLIEASGVPWSILRTTQFHDLVLSRLIKPFDRGDGSPLRIPGDMQFQSIDVKDVAYRLQNLAMGSVLESTLTIGGPEIMTIEEMTRMYLSLQGRNDPVEPEDMSGELYDLFRSGININPEWAAGRITWEKFLRNTLKKL